MLANSQICNKLHAACYPFTFILSELVAHEIVFPGITYITHCHDNMSQFAQVFAQNFYPEKLLYQFLWKEGIW